MTLQNIWKQICWLMDEGWMTYVALILQEGIMYLLICASHTSSCTLPPCQSGSCCRYSLRTRTGRKRWPACRSTSGYYSPDTCPGPKPSHSAGRVAQSLQKSGHMMENVQSTQKKWWNHNLSSFDGTNPTSKSSAVCSTKNIHAAPKITDLPDPHLHDLITEPANHKALIKPLEPDIELWSGDSKPPIYCTHKNWCFTHLFLKNICNVLVNFHNF